MDGNPEDRVMSEGMDSKAMPRRSSCIALIPARGGSKSVPGKNVAEVGGLPLVAWTILAAQKCPYIHRILLTTDSATIGQVGLEFGAEVPFLRPAELARDDTPGIEPVLHAVRWLGSGCPEYVMTLQPTSPLRTSEDMDAAMQLALEEDADAVVSVTPVSQHPHWMKRVSADGRISDYLALERPVFRRQDLPLVYALNGAIYLARRDFLLERQTFYGEKTYAYIMPRERSLDVDSAWDLYLADLILSDRRKLT